MSFKEIVDDVIIDRKFIPNEMDRLDSVYMKIVHRDNKFIGVEIERETYQINDLSSFAGMFRHAKHVFTIASPGLFDSLLCFLSNDAIFKVSMGFDLKTSFGNIKYRNSAISLFVGGKSYYIWNLSKFFKIDIDWIDSDECTCEMISLISMTLFGALDNNDISYSSLYSPASVSRGMLMRYAYGAFNNIENNNNLVKAFYSACYGGRQESTGLGTIDNIYNYDMTKAHLTIIHSMPSLRGARMFIDKDFIDEAAYGVFLLRARVPKMDMCPLPYKPSVIGSVWDGNMHSGYPYGDVYGWYSSQYVKILREMGIKYDIHKSYQYVSVGNIKYPFRNFAKKVRQLMSDVEPWIDMKALYYTITGSMISIRHRVNSSGIMRYHAYNTFNPIMYSHILSYQSTFMYRYFLNNPGVALRADAISSLQSIAKPAKIRIENKGKMLFYTSLLKSFPGGKGKVWKELIEEGFGEPYIRREFSAFPSIGSFVSQQSVKLGERKNISYTILPSYGARKGPHIANVKTMLDTWYKSDPPSVEMVDNGFAQNQKV